MQLKNQYATGSIRSEYLQRKDQIQHDETIHQKMKLSIKDFFSKYVQTRRKLQIWSYLLSKSLMENFNFCAVQSSKMKKNSLVTPTCGIYLISVITSLTYEKKSRNVNQEILWRIAGIDEIARNIKNRPTSTLQTNDIL